MTTRELFVDRAAAGVALAPRVAAEVKASGDSVIVLGIPGGGVLVAAPIAAALGARLGLVQVDPVARASRRRSVTARMRGHLSGQGSMFDSGSSSTEVGATDRPGGEVFGVTVPDVRGATVVVVDDGLHDELEVHRTLIAFRGRGARRLILAAPVLTESAAAAHQSEVGAVITVHRPQDLESPRSLYVNSASPSLREVRAILRAHGAENADEVEVAEAPGLYQRLLVPVDFSAASGRALREADRLARAGGSQVAVLHVGADDGGALVTFVRQFLSEEVDLVLRARRGVPSDEILAEVLEGDYDLVVMGTHGRTGLARAVFGSVAERVLRESLTPVLVTR